MKRLGLTLVADQVKQHFFLFILFHFFVYEILPHSQPTELK